MIIIDDILKISSPAEFENAALEIFRFQAAHCGPYRDYLQAADFTPAKVGSFRDIPYLPVEFFKTHRVYCGAAEPETVFTSSSTGGGGESKHYITSAADYEKTFTRAFELFCGPVREWSFYALLPSYLEREGSSLIRMADGLIRSGRGGGFYLYDHDGLMRDMAADSGKKILLGVSYALLDLAERSERLPAGTTVMETGGMKGRRAEIPKGQMHELVKRAFGVAEIHSEYGMAELMSQAYSAGGGIFHTPPWMKVSVRDTNDPFDVADTGRGGMNIADLANIGSCAFIQTQDIGTVAVDGSFSLGGRMEQSDIRGCNLLVR